MTNWIFLRGLSRDSRHWGHFIVDFQRALPGHSITALDLAGNGMLHQQSSPARVHEMVTDCRTQLACQEVKPPYHLLALSLGAMVALAWAQAYPHEVSGQVLINTSLRPFNPFFQRLRPANYLRLMHLLVANAGPCEWERAILHMTSTRQDASVLPLWVAWRQANPVSRLNSLRQLTAAARFMAPLDPPSPPTLLLASAQDRLVSVCCSRELARRWSCPLVEHASAGHDIPLDDGPWVADQVQEWFLKMRNPG
jgi:pimeloyl-ACP methyl ester carboxylesterase